MIKLLFVLLLSSTFMLCFSAPFGLQTTKGESLELLGLKTKALVEGPFAEVQYIQTYKNPLDHAVETKFLFPRTDSSIFHRFEAIFRNQTLVGRVLEKQTAKRMYDWNVRRGNTVAYSERNQVAPDVMNIKVGNIPAGETVEIVFSVIQPLETIINKFYELKLPVVLTERYTPAHQYYNGHETPNIQTVDAKASLYKEWNIQVELKSNTPFAILSNPTHQLKPELSEQPSTSSSKIYKAIWNVTVVPNKDFVVYFGPEKLEKPETVLATSPQDPNNHVLLVNFIPELNTIGTKAAQSLLDTEDGILKLKQMAFEYDIENAQAEFIFVIDRSGSMEGARIANLRKALAKFLKTIPKTSYFNIISFGSSYQFYKSQSVLNSPQALTEALKWVEETIQADMGGTEILEALKALSHQGHRSKTDLPKIVMILTDGDVFNPDEVINHISASANKMRFCSVGIGSGASDYLVRNMAKAGKCRSEFVQDREDIGDKALYMVQAAISQYITDVRFDINCFNDQNQKVYSHKAELDLLLKDQAFSKWIYLENIENLKSCQATLAYYNSLQSKRVTEEMDIQKYELEEITNFWHKVAYDAKIKELEQAIKKGRNWNQENIKAQVIELSVKYQILSDYTSFLAVLQENTVDPNEHAQQINIPNVNSADYTNNKPAIEKIAKIEKESEVEENEKEQEERIDVQFPDMHLKVDQDRNYDFDMDIQVGANSDVEVDVDVFVNVEVQQYDTNCAADVDVDFDVDLGVDVDVALDVNVDVTVDHFGDDDEPDYDMGGHDVVLNLNTNVEVQPFLVGEADEFYEVFDNVNLGIEFDDSADLTKAQEERKEDNKAEGEESKAGNLYSTQTSSDCESADNAVMKECSGEERKEAGKVDSEEKIQAKVIEEEEAVDHKLTESSHLKLVNSTINANPTESVNSSVQSAGNSSHDLRVSAPSLALISDEKESGKLQQNANLTSEKSLGDNSELKCTGLTIMIVLFLAILF